MTRTQIQLPDDLYRRAKALAADREISLAELVRNGLEYMLSALTPPNAEGQGLEMPVLSPGPEKPDFEDPEFGKFGYHFMSGGDDAADETGGHPAWDPMWARGGTASRAVAVRFSRRRGTAWVAETGCSRAS